MGVGLSRVCVRSADACVAESLEDSFYKVSFAGGGSVVSETLSFAVLGL